MSLQLPTRFGKYELDKYLGGGMSEVYRGRDTVLDRMVAVKILTSTGSQDSGTKGRFLQEAKVMAGLRHDGIVGIHEYGEENGTPFLVMDFLSGKTLGEAILEGRTGDIRKKLDIALQIARALAYIHERKIIHRDIKPDNIHIDESGRVRLMDFGIAKAEGSTVTRTGMLVGTPNYMAPEQVQGRKVTELADVYSYGVVLYELLCGQKAVNADTIEQLFFIILSVPLNYYPLQKANVPSGARNLVERCTAKEPEARMQGFREICADLERLQGTAGEPPKPAVIREAPRGNFTPQRRQVSASRVVFFLVLAALAAIFIFQESLPAPMRGPVAATRTGVTKFFKEIGWFYSQAKTAVSDAWSQKPAAPKK